MAPLFNGSQLRTLRIQRKLGQRAMSGILGISVSYLSQMESGDRPITSKVLDRLAHAFPADWSSIATKNEVALLVGALQAASDPSVPHAIQVDAALQRTLSRQAPLARRMIALHDAFRASQDQLRALDDQLESDTLGGSDIRALPWDEVREWFHEQRNYVDEIDRAAECIGETLEEGPARIRLRMRLKKRFDVEVVADEDLGRTIRAYDARSRTLRVDPLQTDETTTFSLAHLLGRLELSANIDNVLKRTRCSDGAKQLLAAGLANYAAGSILMPYLRFRSAAREFRHDIDRLSRRFGTSFEQTCHRLSNLQRPGLQGLPFFFCRVDMAGNITKRHSATKLQFARFGGACPLWIVHEAAAIPDRVLVQLAETPDGARYVSMAKGLVKPSGSYSRPPRRYAVALGCEVEHAAEFVYADGITPTGTVTPIGASCRTCPRQDCEQRAFPPSMSPLEIDHDRRSVVPYQFT